MTETSRVLDNSCCRVLFCFDVAPSLDLRACERAMSTSIQRETIRRHPRAPRYFEYRPAPLRVGSDCERRAIGMFEVESRIDLLLYDFGAVLVSYAVNVSGRTVEELLDLSDALYEHAALLDDARGHVARLLRSMPAAVPAFEIVDFVEDYLIFDLRIDTAVPVHEWATSRSGLLSRILRAERVDLSEQEIQDAMSHTIAYGRMDLSIVDWNAAILLNSTSDDVLAVLEFANVQLLELRYLDQRLDLALNQSYESLTRRPRAGVLRAFRPERGLEQIGRWQVDYAVLFEWINNALKLLGDPYLARVYRLTAQRFHLSEWETAILRKINTLEGIYQQMSDRLSTRRMEVLEWIIIALFVVSIVLPFLTGGGH